MSKHKSHLYEGMYILSTTLSDEARQKGLEKITSSITARGGEIHKMFDQGRRKLAYEINTRREGHYYILYFSITTTNMNEMWKEYHLNEDLLRFITLRTEQVPERIEFKSISQE